MSYQKHNFTPGAVLLASQLNDMDNEIESLSQGGSGGTVLSDDFKTALLNCFENVAWINENGQLYYNALYNSLYSNDTWSITNLLSGCVTSNNAVSILKNNSYVATISPNQGYTLEGATISITMGGNDVTNLFYSSGSINIPNVTGDLVISVTAVSSVASISAVFTQGTAVIYPTTPLNDLKQYLTVTATWSDSTTSIVASEDYTLSGTLTIGTSTITVFYGGKTDTFTVTVTDKTIPVEYQQVEYLVHEPNSQSIANSWFDTGVILSGIGTLNIEIGMMPTTPSYTPTEAWAAIAVKQNESTNTHGWFVGLKKAEASVTIYGGQHCGFVPNPIIGQKYDIVATHNANGSTITDGTYSNSISYSTREYNQHPIILFGDNFISSNRALFNGRIYYAKVSEDGVDKIDLVPCYRKSDNAVGFYDYVSRTFITPVLATYFSTGPNV